MKWDEIVLLIIFFVDFCDFYGAKLKIVSYYLIVLLQIICIFSIAVPLRHFTVCSAADVRNNKKYLI